LIAAATAVRVVVLDDDRTERDRLGEMLNVEDLKIETLGPSSISETTAAIADVLEGDGPRVVLLDYRLDDAEEASNFRGGSVAATLRDADATRDVPLVLLTTEAKLTAWVESRPGTQDLFDWRLLKGDLREEELPLIRSRLADLANGYWTLSGGELAQEGGWDRIAAALGTERERIASLEDLESELPGGESPAEIGRWILTGPLEWPGPLIDQDEARVVLGVSGESFAGSAVQEWLVPHAYTGLFLAFGPRWWSAPLRGAVADIAGPPGLVDSHARTKALSEVVGARLEAENCSWCDGARTVHVCRVCCRAVDAAHSVRMLAARPPNWADPRVACYTCIAQGRAEDVQLVPEARNIVEKLETGELEQPERE